MIAILLHQPYQNLAAKLSNFDISKPSLSIINHTAQNIVFGLIIFCQIFEINIACVQMFQFLFQFKARKNLSRLVSFALSLWSSCFLSFQK
jgi:hypothetical protein